MQLLMMMATHPIPYILVIISITNDFTLQVKSFSLMLIHTLAKSKMGRLIPSSYFSI